MFIFTYVLKKKTFEQMTATAFLRQFADEMEMTTASTASLLVVVFWLVITVGRLISLRDQRTLTLARLYRHLTIVAALGAVTMLILLIAFWKDLVLWFTVLTFGLFNGPTLGYCYDLSTRVSPNPSTSTAVAMFGLTLGDSLVPFLASSFWWVTGGAFFLPVFLVASHAIPWFLVRETVQMHAAVAGSRRGSFRGDVSSYSSRHSVAAPTPTFGAPPSPTANWSPAGSQLAEERTRGIEEEAAIVEAGAGAGEGEGEGQTRAPSPAVHGVSNNWR